MTPEQFRDLRAALRALRRVTRAGLLGVHGVGVSTAIGEFQDAIWRGKRDLPEYLAMMKAKAKVREKQWMMQRLSAKRRTVGWEVNFTLPTLAEQSEWMHATQALIESRTKYHAARAAFLERIGGNP